MARPHQQGSPVATLPAWAGGEWVRHHQQHAATHTQTHTHTYTHTYTHTPVHRQAAFQQHVHRRPLPRPTALLPRAPAPGCGGRRHWLGTAGWPPSQGPVPPGTVREPRQEGGHQQQQVMSIKPTGLPCAYASNGDCYHGAMAALTTKMRNLLPMKVVSFNYVTLWRPQIAGKQHNTPRLM
jgi:hypothetical protein